MPGRPSSTRRATGAALVLLLGAGAATALAGSGPAAAAASDGGTGPIAAPAAGTSLGVADPYPAVVSISGATGTVTDVRVRLTGVAHTNVPDLDVLLVGPGGQSVVLLSDAASNADVTGRDVSFARGAPAVGAGGLGNGVFAPTDVEPGDAWPAPAPGGAHGTDLGVFDGTAPNGDWRLFVSDDASSDVGSIERFEVFVTTDGTNPPRVAACDGVPDDGFVDLPEGSSPHEGNVDCIAAYGIAQGTGPGTYSPEARVSRAQIATFVARMLAVAGVDLPASPPDAFPGDDAGAPHELSIDQLAALGVIGGNGEQGDRYLPTAEMRRDDMASFLVGAYEVVLGRPMADGTDRNRFSDDEGNPHEAEINALAGRGVVQGTSSLAYEPAGTVSRASMGSFLARTLQELFADGATFGPR